MKRTSFAILIGLFCLFPALFSQVRSEFLLEKNWKFTREDSPEFINPTFNDSKWQSVTVPHDWAIYGPFSSQNDKQEVAIAGPSLRFLNLRMGSVPRSCSTVR